MPKSDRTPSATSPAGGSITSALSKGARASTATGGTRTEDCGAFAAWAKMSITSPAVFGLGSVRWKAWPSPSPRWAMWSMARATKSTGTRLISRPSTPNIGIHWGTALRRRRISLKK